MCVWGGGGGGGGKEEGNAFFTCSESDGTRSVLDSSIMADALPPTRHITYCTMCTILNNQFSSLLLGIIKHKNSLLICLYYKQFKKIK